MKAINIKQTDLQTDTGLYAESSIKIVFDDGINQVQEWYYKDKYEETNHYRNGEWVGRKIGNEYIGESMYIQAYENGSLKY